PSPSPAPRSPRMPPWSRPASTSTSPPRPPSACPTRGSSPATPGSTPSMRRLPSGSSLSNSSDADCLHWQTGRSQGGKRSDPDRLGQMDARILSALAHVEQNITEHLDLEEVSSKIGLSKFYF